MDVTEETTCTESRSMISNWALFCINFRIYWTATFTCCFQNPMSWYKWLTRLDTVLDPQHHCRKSLKKIHKVNVEVMSHVTVQPMLVAGNFQNPLWFTLSCVHGMNMYCEFQRWNIPWTLGGESCRHPQVPSWGHWDLKKGCPVPCLLWNGLELHT
jgi:hypothetical protein